MQNGAFHPYPAGLCVCVCGGCGHICNHVSILSLPYIVGRF